MIPANKILIIRLSSFGDIVLSSPLVRILRALYPDALIDYLVKAEFAELLKFNPNLSAVYELTSSDWSELRSLKKKIRRERYDIILDLHNSLRSRYLRMFSRAGRTGVINKRVLVRFFLVNLKRNYYKKVVPVPIRYLETAACLGAADDGKGLEIFLPEDSLTMVRSLMSRYNLEQYENVFGLAPAAKHLTKRWPQEKFVELGVLLGKMKSTKLLLFGGREDSDYCGDIAQMINAELKASAAESLAGKISLLESAAALDFCSLVVTNDTGIMHLASARKRKTVAIFGSTVREFGFFPFGTESSVIENKGLYCRPCSHIGLGRCPEGHFKCMQDIEASAVLAAVEGMMKKEAGG